MGTTSRTPTVTGPELHSGNSCQKQRRNSAIDGAGSKHLDITARYVSASELDAQSEASPKRTGCQVKVRTATPLAAPGRQCLQSWTLS